MISMNVIWVLADVVMFVQILSAASVVPVKMDIICNPIIRHAMIQTNATMIMVDVNIYVIILQEVMCVHVQVVTTLLLINITALIKMNAMTIMVIVHRTAITLQGAIIVVDNNGNCNQSCTNTHGSFSCSCRNGYRLSGEHDCEDINECLTDTHGCTQ
jgi:hypothetical protein